MRQLSIISHNETGHNSNKQNEKCLDESKNANKKLETKCSLDKTTDKKDLDNDNNNNNNNNSKINVILNNYNNSNNKIQINFATYNKDNSTTTLNE